MAGDRFLQDKADAWDAVAQILGRVRRDWYQAGPTGMAAAVATIKELGDAADSWESYAAAQERKGEPVETTTPQAPIARVTVDEWGCAAKTVMYTPSLPAGEHDLYCEPSAPKTGAES